ncbi:hypothetical protein AAVH_41201 [Aphelenchoides avenae]|nr:hypothetical protein AAVH_41201 [Aphelenchus avenae]
MTPERSGNDGASWFYVSLALNVLLLVLLALSNRELVKRFRKYLESRRPRQEGLLDEVRFNADSDSVGFSGAS